ncbi:MAG: hypothetical protein MI923_04765 [Phycisphaerales bacterium]|nr:hypothetical protein [Phycisphaerales bacterium]
MALTRQRPSVIPLSRRACSTCGVMFMKSRRLGALNQSSLRWLFMSSFLRGGLRDATAQTPAQMRVAVYFDISPA